MLFIISVLSLWCLFVPPPTLFREGRKHFFQYNTFFDGILPQEIFNHIFPRVLVRAHSDHEKRAALVEQLFYLFRKFIFLLVTIFRNGLAHVFDGFPLFVVKLGRNLKIYLDVEIAFSIPLQVLNSLFLKTECGSRLSSRRYLI